MTCESIVLLLPKSQIPVNLYSGESRSLIYGVFYLISPSFAPATLQGAADKSKETLPEPHVHFLAQGRAMSNSK